MVRAYHFLLEDLRSDEDIIAGNSVPWRIGESRDYTPVTIDAGDGEIMTELGYRSSPTLWDAFLQADGPIACLVEVSEVLSIEGDVEAGFVQISGTRRLLAVRDLSAELRLFACSSAERVLYLYEREFPRDDRPRKAIQVARDFARGRASAAELRAALILGKLAADGVPSGIAAQCAAMSAWGSATEEAETAAFLAILTAGWAADGKDASGGNERAWQRALFFRTIERVGDE
jgi:immunity protein 5 of polymorphic toxin system